jgi:hypothetical protein
MGLIKEPLGVDFYVESKPLTAKEREMISQHIREYKAKIAKWKSRRTVSKKKVQDSNK